MPSRSYHQHCSLARALDLVGERWTLLIVRDLLCGARRYKELLAGLPGLGTNLLAARLKELTGLGLLERRRTADDKAWAYHLTEAGRELEEAVVALARFGTRRMGERGESDLWRADWTTLALKANFRAQEARGLRECYEFCVEGVRFHARVEDGELQTAAGAAEDPDLRLTSSAQAFLEFAGGQLSARQAAEHGELHLEGELEALERCQRVFGLPVGVEPS